MSLPAVLEGKLRIPVIGAPMFIVSGPELVIAQCKAGIVGSFPALNARPQTMLDEWLIRIKDELDEYKEANPDVPVAPYAVNQIAHMSNDRLLADMETCVKHQVPIIITSLRPPAEIVEAVHSYGGVVFHDVINLRHAMKAMEQGVDGIITVCAGAGGHAGTTSPFALVKEVREAFDGTIILSGSMSQGNDALAAQAIGADLAYHLGTHVDEAERISQMPPAYQAGAMMMLEHFVSVTSPKPRTKTVAPDPVDTVKAKGTGPGSPESMTVDEYRIWRQNGGTF